jgi:uncharacterized CHY-type Zn-finger protein
MHLRAKVFLAMPTTPSVHGIELDAQTRGAHWRSPLDIVAIKMKCCGVYYACKNCQAKSDDSDSIPRAPATVPQE